MTRPSFPPAQRRQSVSPSRPFLYWPKRRSRIVCRELLQSFFLSQILTDCTRETTTNDMPPAPRSTIFLFPRETSCTSSREQLSTHNTLSRKRSIGIPHISVSEVPSGRCLRSCLEWVGRSEKRIETLPRMVCRRRRPPLLWPMGLLI